MFATFSLYVFGVFFALLSVMFALSGCMSKSVGSSVACVTMGSVLGTPETSLCRLPPCAKLARGVVRVRALLVVRSARQRASATHVGRTAPQHAT